MSDEHDDLCVVGQFGVGQCQCTLIGKVREDERKTMETLDGVNAYDIAEIAYLRGRQDARKAVEDASVLGLPAFENDTPMSVAMRVKAVCAEAACRAESYPPPGP